MLKVMAIIYSFSAIGEGYGIADSIVASNDGALLTLTFNASNSYPDAVITSISFDGVAVEPIIVGVSPGFGDVNFVSSTNYNLPGGNTVDFDADFSFTAAPPPTQNGLNDGESITFQFDTYSLEMVVGVHLQRIGEQSASYVSNILPEPSGLFMFGIACLMALWARLK